MRLLLKDSDSDLLIEGREREEWVSALRVRPVPPNDAQWAPRTGKQCEFLYLDGWWPVKVPPRLHARSSHHARLNAATAETSLGGQPGAMH